LCLTAALAPSSAQVTSTDTEGKGGVDIFLSETYFPTQDAAVHYMDALVLVGITRRLDLLTGPAVNLGFLKSGGIERQWTIEYGFQYKLLERGSWRLLTENAASSPWTNRRTGSHTLFASLSVSKDFHDHKIAVYGGYGPTFTVGNRDDLLFSSKNSAHNFPVGVMIQASEKLQIFLEFGLRNPVYYSSGLSYNIRPSAATATGH
jgi:hypothetical protein